jgi:hypothetical protein
VVTISNNNTAWDTVNVTGKDTKDDILLLGELAEATGGGSLETVGQVENFRMLPSEQVEAPWEKIEAGFAVDSVTAIDGMGHLGSQTSYDLSGVSNNRF